jgi:hypothetical protein
LAPHIQKTILTHRSIAASLASAPEFRRDNSEFHSQALPAEFDALSIAATPPQPLPVSHPHKIQNNGSRHLICNVRFILNQQKISDELLEVVSEQVEVVDNRFKLS